MLALTKTLDPADYALLGPELELVGGALPSGQASEHRRWEYAMALRALTVWSETHHGVLHNVTDVGGAGSPFPGLLHQVTGEPVTVVDPTMNMTLEEYVHSGPRLADVVTCLSVIEHVEDLHAFLFHLSCLVAPGGLLFLTMDCWDKGGPDTAHFSWMRKRIFSLYEWRNMGAPDGSTFMDFERLGDSDHTYHGAQLYGSYSFASLALVKRS